MRRRARRDRLVAEINITPFTDVILVLLIIFMISTPLIFRSGVKVSLPPGVTQQSPPPRTLSITINAAGKVFLDSSKDFFSIPQDLEFLKFKLSARFKEETDPSVVINGDREVKYDVVARVIDLVTQLGVKHVVLAVEAKK